jgi:hypothetical protein
MVDEQRIWSGDTSCVWRICCHTWHGWWRPCHMVRSLSTQSRLRISESLANHFPGLIARKSKSRGILPVIRSTLLARSVCSSCQLEAYSIVNGRTGSVSTASGITASMGSARLRSRTWDTDIPTSATLHEWVKQCVSLEPGNEQVMQLCKYTVSSPCSATQVGLALLDSNTGNSTISSLTCMY